MRHLANAGDATFEVFPPLAIVQPACGRQAWAKDAGVFDIVGCGDPPGGSGEAAVLEGLPAVGAFEAGKFAGVVERKASAGFGFVDPYGGACQMVIYIGPLDIGLQEEGREEEAFRKYGNEPGLVHFRAFRILEGDQAGQLYEHAAVALLVLVFCCYR